MAMIEDPDVFFNTDDFAVDATYTAPSGTPVVTKAILNHDMEQLASERVTDIELIVADVGTPKRNATIDIGADQYLVERIIDNDGFIVTVAVSKV